MKVWQSNSFSMGHATPEKPAQPYSPLVESIRLFTEDGIAVTSDSSGVVKVHDLKTGICETSFSTPAMGIQDIHLVDDTLIVVWWEAGDRTYRVWDVGNGQLVQTVGSSLEEISDLRISEDGSRIFGLGGGRIECRSIQTEEDTGHVEVQDIGGQGRFVVHGYKVWLEGSQDVGWEFGDREISRFSLSTGFPDRPRLLLVDPPANLMAAPAWVQDTVTGRAVFYLPERYMKPGVRRRLDGRYLLIWSRSGEEVVIDFGCVLYGGL